MRYHALLVLWMYFYFAANAFCPTQRGRIISAPTQSRQQFRRQQASIYSIYGKGADIWPPTNESPVQLADSFPNGKIPDHVARRLLEDQKFASDSELPVVEWRRRLIPRALIDRILRRAASAEERRQRQASSTLPLFESNRSAGDRMVAVVALGLVPLIQPIDVLVLALISAYIFVLRLWAQSLRRDGVTPRLPALPPQGHVPAIIDNPLGYDLVHSLVYARWLRLGVGIGLIAPLLWVLFAQASTAGTPSAAARPLFWLCCQALTEAGTRRFLTPLPIRIIVPVVYNVLRLGYLWKWAVVASSGGGRVVSFLVVLNLVYTTVNLFGFLLPVAVPRYLRAHVLGVEVEQVTMRPGMEDSGLGFSLAAYLE
jgi:hypothetical protein